MTTLGMQNLMFRNTLFFQQKKSPPPILEKEKRIILKTDPIAALLISKVFDLISGDRILLTITNANASKPNFRIRTRNRDRSYMLSKTNEIQASNPTDVQTTSFSNTF